MTSTRTIHLSLNLLVAAVWVVNGLLCKVLGLVPRHQEIVARILGDSHAESLTLAIGVSEVLVAIWILSRVWPKLCAATQIIVVLTMNTIELILAPDLLLFGRLNFVLALGFVVLVYYNEFVFGKRSA
jgi:hypothetical protein